MWVWLRACPDHLRVYVCTARTTTNRYSVSNSINDAPRLSTRRCVQSLNLSQMTIQRLLKELKLYPYHLSLLQELKPSDYPHRVNFCRWLLHLADDGNNISVFDTFFMATRLGSTSLDTSIRKTTKYCHAKMPTCSASLGYIRSKLVCDVWFLAVVLSARFSLNRQLLSRCNEGLWSSSSLYSSRWARLSLSTEWYMAAYRLGNNGLPARVFWHCLISLPFWSPQSPDLSPLDYFFWGYLKDPIFRSSPTTIDKLKERITQAIAKITQFISECRKVVQII